MGRNKLVVVTGANRGLGLELARQYLKRWEGEDVWHVVACFRSEHARRCEPFRDDEYLDPRARNEKFTHIRRPGTGISSDQNGVLGVNVDVCVPETLGELRRVLELNKKVDVLINNAGVCIGRECAVGTIDYAAWMTSFDTNVMGATRVLETVLPHLHPKAVVVNVSGRMGSIARVMSGLGPSSATTQDVVYRTTKAALNMVTVCTAAELRKKPETKDVIVVAVDPGWMNTDMGSRGGKVEAPLEPAVSAAGIMRLVDRLEPEDSGTFLNWQGEAMPW